MDTDQDPTPETAPEPPLVLPPRTAADRRFTVYVTFAVLVALGILAFAGFAANTDDDPPPVIRSRPEVVEHLVPRSGASVLRQAELGIDLAPGYEAALVVNGIEIPAEQTRAVPEQNQVFFSPGQGKVIEELQGGETCVVAIAWRSAQGRGVADQRFQWCFDVT